MTPVPIGPVSVGSRSFVRGGERRLVAVVKATFDLTPDGTMRLVAPAAMAEEDLGLRLPSAQVLSIGMSHAPAGARVGVRLAVARGEVMLVDQRVDVPEGSPAGFAGIPREAPKRRALRGSCPAEIADRAFDAILPADFDEAYFVSAPPDQCVSGAWSGGEMVALVHLHPRFATIRTFLPRGRAVALLQTDRGARVPIKLRCDTLVLRPESLRAELVWRGDVRVDEESLRGARVGGAWTEGADVDFPDLREVPAQGSRNAPVFAGAAAAAGASAAEETGPSTVRLDLPDDAPPPPARRKRADATMILEAAPDDAPPARRRGRAGTMVMAPDAPAVPAPMRPTPPAVRTSPAGPSHGEGPEEASPNTVLMPAGPPSANLADEPTAEAHPEPSPRSLPFQGARARRKVNMPAGSEPTPTSRARRAPLPGAPGGADSDPRPAWQQHRGRRCHPAAAGWQGYRPGDRLENPVHRL